ncbi:MAG: thioredoxin family protein [Flavobacteriaceae bacterium]|nr:MAG: thioredoxin family protein [Flavobacteriaceae bacterium]
MKKTMNFALVGLLLVVSAFTVNDTIEVDGYAIGDFASDFNLMSTTGNMVSMADYPNAKGFLIVFTCNSCPYAVAYEDRIIALDRKYKGLGVPVIAINPNNPDVQPSDSYEKMKVRAKEKGFTFPYLLDDGQKVFPKYGATRTPHVFLLNKTKEGNKVVYIGAVDDNSSDASAVETTFVEDAVDAMLAGTPIEIKTTRAIGCTIKV